MLHNMNIKLVYPYLLINVHFLDGQSSNNTWVGQAPTNPKLIRILLMYLNSNTFIVIAYFNMEYPCIRKNELQ